MEHLRGLRIEKVAIFGGGGLSLLEEGVRNTLVWFRRDLRRGATLMQFY